MCTPQSRCKCRKNKVQCSQYCHNSRRDCGNAGPLQAGTEAVVLSRSEDDSETDSTGQEGEESSKARPGKNGKRLRALTNSDRKRKKVVTTAGLQKHSKESEGDMEQTTLSQYKNAAPVINRLQGLRECVVIGEN